MEGRYFTDFNENIPSHMHVDRDKIIDIRDVRWAHPAIREVAVPWDNSAVGWSSCLLVNPEVPHEQKVAMVGQMGEMIAQIWQSGDIEHSCDITTYEVPGCPEEPEASTTMTIYRPKGLTDQNARCMFYVLGGALPSSSPRCSPSRTWPCATGASSSRSPTVCHRTHGWSQRRARTRRCG